MGALQATDRIDVIEYTITMQFKTTSPNGILLFAEKSPVYNHDDFIGIYIKNGYIIHNFDNSPGKVTVTSASKYNDGQWHFLKAIKNSGNNNLCVDNVCKSKSTSQGSTAHIIPQYKVGGVPNNLISKAQHYMVSLSHIV